MTSLRWIVLTATLLCAGCGLKIQGVELDRLAKIGERAITSSEAITPQQETQIGSKMAAVLLGTAPLVNDRQLQLHVNKVGRWISMHGERQDIAWHFGVIDTPDINAFAAPGGFILVTRGLLAMLDGDDELAAVLAHEIAHVNEKHHLKALDKTKGADIAGQLALLTGEVYNARQSHLSRNALRNQEIAKGLLSATQTLYVKGLSREDEWQADAKGLILMARSGFDPFAMVAVLQKLEAISATQGQLDLWLSTHPAPRDRLERLKPILSKLEG